MSNAAHLIAEYDVQALDHGSPAFSAETARSPSRSMMNGIELCLNQIATLKTEENIRPSNSAIASFATWLPLIFDRAYRLGRWDIPHITCSDQSEIVCEWWNGERKLTIYFGPTSEYIKVWGTDIDTEMESGELHEGWSITAIWLWLHSR